MHSHPDRRNIANGFVVIPPKATAFHTTHIGRALRYLRPSSNHLEPRYLSSLKRSSCSLPAVLARQTSSISSLTAD